MFYKWRIPPPWDSDGDVESMLALAQRMIWFVWFLNSLFPWFEKVCVKGGRQSNSILLGHKKPLTGNEPQSLSDQKIWNQSSAYSHTIWSLVTTQK